MENRKIRNALWKISLFALVAATTLLTIWPAPGYSQTKDSSSVVLVPLTFEDERWFLGPGEISILPCEAPSKFIQGAESDPLIRILGPEEKVIYQRQMRNPRLILVEDPKEVPPLLSKVSFNLKFALIDGMETFEFWYDRGRQKEATVTANLQDPIKEYMSKGGPLQKAPCQEFKYVPDQLGK